MHFKILFHILPLVLVSCSQLSKEECQRSSIEATASKDGASGTANRYYRIKKKCKIKDDLEATYNKSYIAGLFKFCDFKRGMEQAGLGLEKESACLISSDYKEGYLKKLEGLCDSQKARIDARNLLNSDNRLCLSVPKYKNSYVYHLKKQCSYKKGYSIGLLKKGIDQNCQDSTSIRKFRSGYNAGLSRGYTLENRGLQKEIAKLQVQRKPLQIKIKTEKKPEEVQKNKIDLNVLESKILELEHQMEKNKRFIN